MTFAYLPAPSDDQRAFDWARISNVGELVHKQMRLEPDLHERCVALVSKAFNQITHGYAIKAPLAWGLDAFRTARNYVFCRLDDDLICEALIGHTLCPKVDRALRGPLVDALRDVLTDPLVLTEPQRKLLEAVSAAPVLDFDKLAKPLGYNNPRLTRRENREQLERAWLELIESVSDALLARDPDERLLHTLAVLGDEYAQTELRALFLEAWY